MIKFQDNVVERKFEEYPHNVKKILMYFRSLIFRVAKQDVRIGNLIETLKWGEPSYLSENSSGTTIRIDWKKSSPEKIYIYFNCKTSMISDIKFLFGDLFVYGGNRSLILDINNSIPVKELEYSIFMALTYKLEKKK